MNQHDSAEPSPGTEVAAVKDAERQRPIPTAWRPVLGEIVRAFAKGDYRLACGVPGVEAVSEETAAQIRGYVADYGAALVELSPQTWESSVCIWYGDHWNAIVDLWTESEGRSDMVLEARVRESAEGFAFTVVMVYVP